MYECYMSLFPILKNTTKMIVQAPKSNLSAMLFHVSRIDVDLYATQVIQISSCAFTSSLFSLFPLHV